MYRAGSDGTYVSLVRELELPSPLAHAHISFILASANGRKESRVEDLRRKNFLRLAWHTWRYEILLTDEVPNVRKGTTNSTLRTNRILTELIPEPEPFYHSNFATGAKLRRWMAQGPNDASAARCCLVG